MVKTETQHDAGVESPPAFASQSEIELAERLRRQLEQRFLEPAAPSPKPGQHAFIETGPARR